MNSTQFLDIIKKECDKVDVKYLFPETKEISYLGNDNIKVSGYFDDKTKTLACAIGKLENEWYEILIHESCHMDQWLEQDKLWLNITANGIDCDKGMDEFFNGKEFHKDEYTYYIRTMQAVEIDCEKRSVEKIKKLDLPINIKNYIKKANSYLYFYSIALETHKWCDVAPYEVPEIIELMPDYFLENYENVSEELLNLYKEKCY